MKKKTAFLMLLLWAGLTACDPEEKTQSLTYQGFIENIWDFETYPDHFVYKGNTPIIVDFYAKWCGPCRQLLPIMEQMAVAYEGDLKVYKVNVDEETRLAHFFKVEGLPVFFFFSTDGYSQRYTGLPTEAELRQLIEKQIKK